MSKYSTDKIIKQIEEQLQSDGDSIHIHSISPIRNGLFLAVICYYPFTDIFSNVEDIMPELEMAFYDVKGNCRNLYEAINHFGDAVFTIMKESPIPPFLNENEMESQLDSNYLVSIDETEEELDDTSFHFTKLARIDDVYKNEIRAKYESKKEEYQNYIKAINKEIEKEIENSINSAREYANRCYDNYDNY